MKWPCIIFSTFRQSQSGALAEVFIHGVGGARIHPTGEGYYFDGEPAKMIVIMQPGQIIVI